jgi:hypothetical protein
MTDRDHARESMTQIWEDRRAGLRPWPTYSHRRADFTPPTESGQIGYLAGLFDEEGSLGIRADSRYKDSKSIMQQVDIANTSSLAMDWLSRFGGRVYKASPQNDGYTRRPCYRWKLLRTTEVLTFLKLVLPYLTIKRDIALAAIPVLEAKIGKGRCKE